MVAQRCVVSRECPSGLFWAPLRGQQALWDASPRSPGWVLAPEAAGAPLGFSMRYLGAGVGAPRPPVLPCAEGAWSGLGAGIRALWSLALMLRLPRHWWMLGEGAPRGNSPRRCAREGGGQEAGPGLASVSAALGSCVGLQAPRGQAGGRPRGLLGVRGASHLGVPLHAYSWEEASICALEDFCKILHFFVCLISLHFAFHWKGFCGISEALT